MESRSASSVAGSGIEKLSTFHPATMLQIAGHHASSFVLWLV
jgi:hypothetical protein